MKTILYKNRRHSVAYVHGTTVAVDVTQRRGLAQRLLIPFSELTFAQRQNLRKYQGTL